MVIGLMVGPRIAGARGHLIDPVSTLREGSCSVGDRAAQALPFMASL